MYGKKYGDLEGAAPDQAWEMRLMGAQKRLTGIAVPTALCLAALWLAVIIALTPLQRSAAEANKAYQFSIFATHILGLAGHLQDELVLSALPVIPDGGDAREMQQAAAKARRSSHLVLAKAWGRFDSTPFGASFRNQIETALKQLKSIDRDSGQAQASDAGFMDLTLARIEVAAGLTRLGPHAGNLVLGDDKADRLGKKFSSAVKLAHWMNIEMLAGLRVLAGKAPPQDVIASWNQAARQRAALLQRFLLDGSAETELHPGQTDWLNLAQAAAGLGNRFLADARSHSDLEFPGKDNWISTYGSGVKAVVLKANEYRARLFRESLSQAKHAHVIFILAVLAASALTLSIFVWRGNREPGVLFWVFVATINVPFLWWGLTAGSEFLADEGGVLETAQAVTLIIAFALFCSDAAKLGQPLRSGALVMTSVCLFMFFREMDFRTFGAPDWIIGLSSGSGRRVLFSLGAGIVLLYAVRHRHNLLALVPSGLSLRAWPFYLWPVLLLLGEGVEVLTHATRKDDLQGYWTSGQLWEEMLELDAYFVLAYASFIFSRIIGPVNTAMNKNRAPSRQGGRSRASAKQPVK